MSSSIAGTSRSNIPELSSPVKIVSVQIVEATLTGVGRHAIDVCEQLVQFGHHVVLFYADGRMDRQFRERLESLKKQAASDTTLQFEHFSCPMQRSIGMSDLRAVKQVREYLHANRTTRMVCHGHSSKGGAIARLAAAKCQVPAVYTPNAIASMNPIASTWKRIAFAKLERWLAAKGRQHVIATSPDEYEHLRDYVRIPEKQITIIPNGIAPPELPSKDEARQNLNLPNDAIVAGFVGRLASQKAIDVLIRAWQLVMKEAPNAVLAMIGNGPLEAELKKQAKDIHGIRWLGEQPGQVSMPAFDFFVLPSRYEGLPYVLMESLAAKLPIIVSDRASAGGVVTDGENGFVVPCENHQVLAQRIVELVRDASIREQFSRASEHAAGRFTAENMTKSVVEVYENLLG